MMFATAFTLTTPSPPEAVWAYVSDLGNVTAWNAAATGAQPFLDQASGKAGTLITFSRWPKTPLLYTRATGGELPHTAAFVAEDPAGGEWSRETFSVSAGQGGGAVLEYEVQIVQPSAWLPCLGLYSIYRARADSATSRRQLQTALDELAPQASVAVSV